MAQRFDPLEAWKSLDPALRIELVAEIADARRWRYGDNEPLWLQPIFLPALELALWRSNQTTRQNRLRSRSGRA